MRALYTLLLYLLTPLVLLRLVWRGRRAPAYRRRWRERFGWISAVEGRRPIWLHAVSVGEVLAAVPLAQALLERYPERPLLITTTTPTGSERVRAAFGDRVRHCYAPYDLPGSVRRFLRRARPALAVVMETELWPNLYAGLGADGVPLLVLNARLSDRSAAGYRRLGPLTRETLGRISAIGAQSPADAERFVTLGAPPGVVSVPGNIKFDLRLDADLAGRGAELRRAVAGSRPVWIAASTHAGEEEAVLEAHGRLRERWPELLLVLVPRHPERFEPVAGLCLARRMNVARRGRGELPGPGTAVYLGDTMGELMLLYAAADLAFVGGSLVPTGGHNLLEPAALALPVLSGPQLFNFRLVSELLLAAGAMAVVADAEALAATVAALLDDPPRRRRMGEAGRAVVDANRGALQRCLALIADRLPAASR